MSNGKIIKQVNNKIYEFTHNASTEGGSSGSPIVLKDDYKILGIHRGGKKNKKINHGCFIGPVIDFMKNQFKKNGERIEYYKNGNKKYEGNFSNDEYNGKGKFYNENGNYYDGEFKNGKKNGIGYIFDKDNKMIKKVIFSNDELINEEESIDNKNSDNENDDFNNNKEDSDNNDDKKSDSDKKEDSDDDSEDNRKNNSDENDDFNNNDDSDDDKDNNKDNNKDNSDKNDYSNNNDVEDNVKYNEDSANNNYSSNSGNHHAYSNNNNNTDLNFNNLFDILKTQSCHIFHDLGNALGVRCTSCGHLTQSHEEIGFGKWKCHECNKTCATFHE